MTPKEKAEELVNEMFDYTEATYQAAKQCAADDAARMDG